MKEPFDYSIVPYTLATVSLSFLYMETPVSLAGNASISGRKRSFPCAETVVSRLGTGVLTLETSASMIGK